MDIRGAPFFAILHARLNLMGDRQQLIASNLANVATPGFTPQDLDVKAFERAVGAAAASADPGRLTLARTNAGHLPNAGGFSGSAKVVASPDGETTLDGNQVVLEDQILKAGETRMAFETSLALYQKGLAMIRTAARGVR